MKRRNKVILVLILIIAVLIHIFIRLNQIGKRNPNKNNYNDIVIEDERYDQLVTEPEGSNGAYSEIIELDGVYTDGDQIISSELETDKVEIPYDQIIGNSQIKAEDEISGLNQRPNIDNLVQDSNSEIDNNKSQDKQTQDKGAQDKQNPDKEIQEADNQDDTLIKDNTQQVQKPEKDEDNVTNPVPPIVKEDHDNQESDEELIPPIEQPELPDLDPEPENPDIEPENPDTEPENPDPEPENPDTEPENPDTEPELPGTGPVNPGPIIPGGDSTVPGGDPVIPGGDPVIPEKRAEISLSQENEYCFPVITEDNQDSLPYTVEVINTGEMEVTHLLIQLSGVNADCFELSMIQIDQLEIGDSQTFMITPVSNLAEGKYTATVSVSSDQAKVKSFEVSIIVEAASSIFDFTAIRTLRTSSVVVDQRKKEIYLISDPDEKNIVLFFSQTGYIDKGVLSVKEEGNANISYNSGSIYVNRANGATVSLTITMSVLDKQQDYVVYVSFTTGESNTIMNEDLRMYQRRSNSTQGDIFTGNEVGYVDNDTMTIYIYPDAGVSAIGITKRQGVSADNTTCKGNITADASTLPGGVWVDSQSCIFVERPADNKVISFSVYYEREGISSVYNVIVDYSAITFNPDNIRMERGTVASIDQVNNTLHIKAADGVQNVGIYYQQNTDTKAVAAGSQENVSTDVNGFIYIMRPSIGNVVVVEIKFINQAKTRHYTVSVTF